MIDERTIPELLAPAGSIEMMRTVIASGADAVYMGGTRFGARAYAKNPEREDLLDAIDEAHLYGVRVHLTVNTLLKDTEMDELYAYMAPIYERGVDAVLVQDLGVLSFLHETFPDLPLHASTQMSLTGAAGVRLLAKEGISRAVLARELSLDEIREIKNTCGIEIEVFAHGALCVCYSGRCLMSGALGGRSGNRGRCAGPCRLPYRRERGQRIISDPQAPYLLSPKDLCTIDRLPMLIDAGVDSLKIEGRMKQPVYAAGVTALYRKALDQYQKTGDTGVTEEDRALLHALFDRDGFTDGYLMDDLQDMMAIRNERLQEGGTADEMVEELKQRFLHPIPKIPVNGHVILRKGRPASLTVENMTSTGAVVDEAQARPLGKETVLRQMQKTNDTPFSFEELRIDLDPDVFLPLGALNALRRDALLSYRTQIISEFHRLERAGGPLEKPDQHKEQFLPVQEGANHTAGPSVEALVTTKEQFFAALRAEDVDVLIAETELWTGDGGKHFISECANAGKPCIVAMPQIVRQARNEQGLIRLCKEAIENGASALLCRDMEGLALLFEAGLSDVAYADASLYTMNAGAQRFLARYARYGNTAPLELSLREFTNRDHWTDTLVVYGRIPLMVTAQAIGETGDVLRDRKQKSFPLLWYNRDGLTVICNSVPLYLCDMVPDSVRRIRYWFTTEDGAETEKILSGEEVMDYTRGHVRRGVE